MGGAIAVTFSEGRFSLSLKNFLALFGIISSDRQVGWTIEIIFQLIGAPLRILGAKVFMSLVDVDALFPRTVLHTVINNIVHKLYVQMNYYYYYYYYYY